MPIPKFDQEYATSFDPLVPEREPIPAIWWLLVPGLIVLIVLVGYLILQVDNLILKRLTPEKQLLRVYRRIYRYARWTKLDTKPGDTPRKFSNKLIHQLRVYGRGSKQAEWILYGSHIIREVTRRYYLTQYSPDQGANLDNRDIAILFRDLRSRFWYLWLLVRAYPYRLPRFFLWDSAPMLINSPPTKS